MTHDFIQFTLHDADILPRFFEVTLVTGFYNETNSNETKLREFVSFDVTKLRRDPDFIRLERLLSKRCYILGKVNLQLTFNTVNIKKTQIGAKSHKSYILCFSCARG